MHSLILSFLVLPWLAYPRAHRVPESQLEPPTRPKPRRSRHLEIQNSPQFRHTGSPVPRGWQPPVAKMVSYGEKRRTSVAQLAEQQATTEAAITYVHPTRTSHLVVHQVGKQAQGTNVSFSLPANASAQGPSVATDKRTRDRQTGDWQDQVDQWEDQAEEWQDPKADIDWDKVTGISRCGFSWDDAAAKRGAPCAPPPEGYEGMCKPPANTVDNPLSYWYNATYACFTDLPKIEDDVGTLTCNAASQAQSSEWCQLFCNQRGSYCGDNVYCSCKAPGKLGTPDEVYNASAPIQAPADDTKPEDLPNQTTALVESVKGAAKAQPGGLPPCTWRPPKGCTADQQYQCIEGEMEGECSEDNWFERKTRCAVSCVHTSLLSPAPYYPLWYPGPLAMEFQENETQPRYQTAASKISLKARGIDLTKSDVMMSSICQSNDNHFVGVSMYSPNYKKKAERLLRSCARAGVCCKARLLPADAFGEDAPEGSEDFRFQTIASKPAFILGELESTELPVVFLDTDLEFHSFPHLFVPGSWPNGERDVAIFNFWGNETDLEVCTPQNLTHATPDPAGLQSTEPALALHPRQHASTPTTGSGVVFFNHTSRAKSVLTAWAEAMAWEGNYRAPDDQVLDVLLKQGGWLRRASFGWLPASYLRTMPSYYRGVDPVVIDHDHGSAPGILNHSMAKPKLPPIERTELCNPVEPAPRPWNAEEAEEQKKWSSQGNQASSQQQQQPDDSSQEEEEKAIRLPEGTCNSTASENQDATEDQKKGWNSWCDENCIPEKWGGFGKGGCGEGAETGRMGCTCKHGVKPVYAATGEPVPGYEEALQQQQQGLQEAAQSQEGSTSEEQSQAPASQQASDSQSGAAEEVRAADASTPDGQEHGECTATNPDLTPDEQALWDGWCAEQCGPPDGHPENCLRPEQTGAARCACDPARVSALHSDDAMP